MFKPNRSLVSPVSPLIDCTVDKVKHYDNGDDFRNVNLDVLSDNISPKLNTSDVLSHLVTFIP